MCVVRLKTVLLNSRFVFFWCDVLKRVLQLCCMALRLWMVRSCVVVRCCVVVPFDAVLLNDSVACIL